MLANGTSIGPYEITAFIGSGGMGEVYRAADTRIRRDVALKILSAAFTANRDRLVRFEQEARAVGAINHPNLVTLYDLGTHDGSPYIVMELLEGSTLRDLLPFEAATPLPLRNAIEYASQLANGLGAAHEKGVVHRDLKPENIFITNDGRVKILDFGLAKLTASGPLDATDVRQATTPGTIMGTVGYMAPEQVRGQAVDHRADIFSFGAVLYEMVSGRRAFRGTSAADTISAILREDPPELAEKNPALPVAFEDLVRHCLEKNPSDRFQSARDIAYHLQQLKGETGRMRAVSAGRSRLRIRTALEIGLFAVALTSAIAWATARRNPSLPLFRRVTFARGIIGSVFFTPGVEGFVYSATPSSGIASHMYEGRFDSPERRELPIDGDLRAMSKNGEMAVDNHDVLERVALTGGGARPLTEHVGDAWWLPDGTALAVQRSASGMQLIEHPIGHVIYRTSSNISARLSHDGRHYALAIRPPANNGGDVAVLDLQGHVSRLAPGWSHIHGLAWSPDDKEIWFTAARTGSERSLWAVDMSGHLRQLARIAGALSIEDVAPDGRALVLRMDRSAQTIVSTPAGQHDLSWLDFSIVGDISRDGTKVLFTEAAEGGGPNNSVYIRGVDSAPAVRLGEGVALALSPDGAWAAAMSPSDNRRIELLPVGAGEPRMLPRGNVEIVGAGWFPDGKRLLVTGNVTGRPSRSWSEDLEGRLQALTPENEWCTAVTDGGRKCVLNSSPAGLRLYSFDDGKVTPLPGIDKSETVCGATDDGRYLFLRPVSLVNAGRLPISRYEIATGKSEPWRELEVSDIIGAQEINGVVFSSDGRSIAFSFRRFISDVYLLSGLRR